MATQAYNLGNDVTSSVLFTAANVPVDPTGVTFDVQAPDGTKTSYVYGVDSQVVRVSTGRYSVTLTPSARGLYHYDFTGTGAVEANEDGAFFMKTPFPDPLPTFVDVPMLAAYLRADIDYADPLANLALQGATQAIRKYTDQMISYVEDDEIVLPGNGLDVVLLPEIPVVGVSLLSFGDVDLATDDYSWNAEGIVTRSLRSSFTTGGQVGLTYSHGYAAVPADVQMITVIAAARGWAQQGESSTSASGYSVTFAGQPGELTDGEKRVLDRYRTVRS